MYSFSHQSFFWFGWTVILIEAVLLRLNGRSLYSWKESLASLGIAFGQGAVVTVFKSFHLGVLLLVWEHRLWTLTLDSWGMVFWLFLGLEFCYYWHHRAAHYVRWLWATHSVHHSAEYLNLSAAYRLGWTGWLSGNIVFFLPLCWIGFHPMSVLTGLSLNLLYQFWIHCVVIPQLGWMEWIFNTPSHHRVHHASNSDYLDRNFGGVLIIFDRLFGTFKAEDPFVEPIYGLTQPIRSHNPVVIALHEWGKLFKDLQAAKDWKQRFRYAFFSPGWSVTNGQHAINRQQIGNRWWKACLDTSRSVGSNSKG